MRHPLYTFYSLLMLAVMGVTAYNRTPLFPASVNEVKNIPKTVRDNPGAYRSIYGGNPHYVGGK